MSALSTLARTLGVSPEDLLGETNTATRKRGSRAETTAAYGTHQPVAETPATHGDGNAGGGSRSGKPLKKDADYEYCCD